LAALQIFQSGNRRWLTGENVEELWELSPPLLSTDRSTGSADRSAEAVVSQSDLEQAAATRNAFSSRRPLQYRSTSRGSHHAGSVSGSSVLTLLQSAVLTWWQSKAPHTLTKVPIFVLICIMIMALCIIALCIMASLR